MAPKPRRKSHEPEWLVRVRNYYWIHDVLHIYVGLFTWVLQWSDENRLSWLELTPEDPLKLRPVHFEKLYKREAERDAYYFRCLKKVSQTKKALVEQHQGFHDLFLPIELAGRDKAVLYAGSFLRKPATWETLASPWTKLTGKEPSSQDSEFNSYVRMALQLPVLDDVLLKAILEFYGIYTDLLTGRNRGAPPYQKADELRQKVFAARLPNKAWVEEALGLEKLIPTPWAWYTDQGLAPWMREELGISRIPTVVIALMPLSGNDPEPVRDLLRNDALQRECFQFAKGLSQTVAGKLQDYGTLFLTSPDPEKSVVQARLQLRDRAEKIRDFVRKKFGVRTVIGIGRPVPERQSLYESYREAVLALHLCVQTEKPILFYGETPEMGKGKGYGRLHEAGLGLLSAHGKASLKDAQLAADRYVREVLEFAEGNLIIVRGQLLSIFFRLLDLTRERSALNPQDVEEYAGRTCRKLEESDSTYRLLGAFKEALQTLSGLGAKPLEGAKALRMESILKYLADHFNQPLRLTQVAKQAGFSVPVFCRVFKKTTGLSFVAHLNQLRVEQAKNLLRTSGLNILQIGQACGFQTPHHFIRNFKRLAGVTPGDYRKKNATSV